MGERKGTISVKTNDIFPIIKKWLYSEHDIFIRELIANATDAITKRETLGRMENREIPKGSVSIRLNKSKKEIRIIDNGVGMTEEEVEKYIAQLAFSGAEEFVQKMKDSKHDIIGKFGLGFYSSFMVADLVTIDTLSAKKDAKAVCWMCRGDTDYTFKDSNRKEIGTTVTLKINKESEDFLNEYKLSETLNKFCSFLPYTIDILDEERKPERPFKEDGTVDEKAPAVVPEPKVINDTQPLWKKDPKDITEEEYKTFYQKLFPMDQAPLFWLHLKVDHPFTLEGILYFPKINLKRMNVNEHNINLYCKQVFVSDNVKDVVPDFLSLLKGVIDSTDIPLNVSRSSLQGDPNVKKIAGYIVKKVAEALKKLFNNDREKYAAIWPDIGLFVKYGCISDTKFDELMRERTIFKDANSKFVTLDEYRSGLPKEFKEKIGDKVLYFEQGKSDPALCVQLKSHGIYPIEIDETIDPHFMQHAEFKKQGDKTWKFVGVDGEISNILETENQTPEDVKVKELFNNILAKEEKEGGGKKEVEIQKFKDVASPAYFKTDEQMKRMAQMAQSMGSNNALPMTRTLVINPGNPLIQNALKIHEKGDNKELVEKICHHVEDLATISVDGLSDEGKEHFVKRSQDLIRELTHLAL